MKSRRAFLMALVLLVAFVHPSSAQVVSATPSQRNESFRFQKGQRVYVVAVETASRDLSLTKANLEIERRAKDQFRSEKQFQLAQKLTEADFVFFVLVDASSSLVEEVALALLPSNYQVAGGNLDDLRNAALWQDSANGKPGVLGLATLGWSNLFKSVSKDLVKKFHKDIASNPVVSMSVTKDSAEVGASTASSRSTPPTALPQATLNDMIRQGIGPFLEKRILIWTEETARVVGGPLTHRYGYDAAQNVTSDIYTYPDPTKEYDHLELAFDSKTTRLTTVILYPIDMTWGDCEKLWGSEVISEKNPNGTELRSYVKRRLNVFLDQQGRVISLGLY